MRPTVRSFFRGGTAPRSPNFGLVVHNYRQTATDWTKVFLTVNNSRMRVLTNAGHREATSINLSSPLVAVRRTRGETTNTLTHLMSPYTHNLMYSVDQTFSYHSQKFIRTCAESSAHAHGTKIRGGHFKHFYNFIRTRKVMGSLPLTHKVACHYQTSDNDPRTGIFHQMQVTAGDTICNVDGVKRFNEPGYTTESNFHRFMKRE